MILPDAIVAALRTTSGKLARTAHSWTLPPTSPFSSVGTLFGSKM